MLVTSKTEIEHAYANGTGYNLRNIQGYIYAPCVHEPSCIPAGATKLWREYNTANQDCATFLDRERGEFESRGYIGYCPVCDNTKMPGYAYSTCTPCGAGIYTLPCRGDSIFKNGFEVL